VLRILKPIRYVFYRILVWKLRDVREDTPVLVAGLGTSLLLFLNGILAFMVINDLSGRALLPELHRGLVEYLTAAILFLTAAGVMGSAWFVNRNFDPLQQEFGVTTPTREHVRTVLFWSYIVLSAVAPLVYAILWHALHG
jgi:hypothetical protein